MRCYKFRSLLMDLSERPATLARGSQDNPWAGVSSRCAHFVGPAEKSYEDGQDYDNSKPCLNNLTPQAAGALLGAVINGKDAIWSAVLMVSIAGPTHIMSMTVAEEAYDLVALNYLGMVVPDM